MRVQDVIDRLIALGLSPEEASCYVHLSMMGPSKAADVAAALKLNRTETYRRLRGLTSRGFASEILGRPTRFVAAPPERLFEDLLEQQKARTVTIERAREEIAPALVTLRAEPGEDLAKNTFKVIQGRREIYAACERMIREARATVATLTTHPAAGTMGVSGGLWPAIADQARAGRAVRAIVRESDEVRERLRPVLDGSPARLREVATERIFRFVVVDDRELLMWVVSDPSGRLASDADVAIWTDAADFVATQAALFESIWEDGRDLFQPAGAVRRA